MIKRLLTICLTFAVISGMAGEMDAYHFTGKSKKSGNNPKNVASLGLLGLGMLNVSLKYERSIKPWCSFRIHAGMMIPHSSSFLDNSANSANDGSVTKVENELNGWHVKPEFVFYPGSKGSPKGYYIGLYGKVDKYGITVPAETKTNSFEVTGSISRIGGGMIMGYQWLIKDKVSIDWWFLGLGLDNYTIALESSSKNSEVITEADKEEIKNSVTFMGKSPTVETSNNNKDVKVTLPSFLFPCFRFGLSVGYAF